MKIIVTSQEKYIIKNIIEMINNLRERSESGTYSSAIEFAISELVRDAMRINAESVGWEEQDDLLDIALELTQRKLNNELEESGIHFKTDKYFNNVEKKLDFPARELTELGAQLVESKQKSRLGLKESLQSEGKVPFEIIELGLSNAIDTLLTKPLAETCEIDTERIKGRYEIEGDWFPFQIIIDDLTFVIDDDGTIFVSVENLPSELVSRARKGLQQLARLLYFNSQG